MSTTPEVPITLAELRSPINYANTLILTGLALCLKSSPEQDTAAPNAIVEKWLTTLTQSDLPSELEQALRELLSSKNVTTDLVALQTGLDIILQAVPLRFWATRKVGQLKAAHNLPVLDEAREAAILSQMQAEVTQRGLPSEVVLFFSTLMQIVRSEHQALRE